MIKNRVKWKVAEIFGGGRDKSTTRRRTQVPIVTRKERKERSVTTELLRNRTNSLGGRDKGARPNLVAEW